MSVLLEMRENLKNIYNKHEVFITPVLKFLLAMVSLATINSTLGYMNKLNNPVIVIVVSLMCSFLPINFIIIVATLFVLGHLYAITLECALVALALFLLLYLLYFRFSPKDTLVVLLLPILFLLKIPYVIPIAMGLIATPASIVSVMCGVVIYYLIYYVETNATAISSLDSENAVAKIRYIIDGMLTNKAMLVAILAFSAVVIIVFLIRKLSVDHAWTVAMVVGAVTGVVVLLMGDLVFETNISILGVIIGTVISLLLVKVLQFFVFNVDYTRTEFAQFEDDEYFYYVKAIPKNTVSKTEKTVKKITNVGDTSSMK